MAAVLQGNTATKVMSNHHVLKIQLIDDERLFYQFLDVVDQKAYEIVEAEITMAPNESSEETEFCFYLDSDKEKDTPYFISEFLRDDFGRRFQNRKMPETFDGLPAGKLVSLTSNGYNT